MRMLEHTRRHTLHTASIPGLIALARQTTDVHRENASAGRSISGSRTGSPARNQFTPRAARARLALGLALGLALALGSFMLGTVEDVDIPRPTPRSEFLSVLTRVYSSPCVLMIMLTIRVMIMMMIMI